MGLLAEVGLRLAEGLFSLLARTSLAENMAACLLLVSTLVELLDQQAAPLLQPIASTAERVGPPVRHTHAAHACMGRDPAAGCALGCRGQHGVASALEHAWPGGERRRSMAQAARSEPGRARAFLSQAAGRAGVDGMPAPPLHLAADVSAGRLTARLATY